MVDLLSRFPEILPREPDSVFRRFVEAHEEELEEYEDNIAAIKLTRQVDNASGDDLDRIGRLFGEVGERLERDDETYRQYLKSAVQAFSGRGTRQSMRKAFAAAMNLDIEDIEIVEDTTNVEYEVVLSDWGSHNVSTMYEIGQIVDPSGVHMETVRYTGFTDSAGVGDATSIQQNPIYFDEAGVTDSASVAPKSAEIAEDAGISDVDTLTTRNVSWNDGNWETSYWAVEHN